MKKFIFLFLSLFILVPSFLVGCGVEKNSFNWTVPIFPGAELVITRSWSTLPPEEPWSEIEWRYYLTADKYSLDRVSSFYENGMLANEWQNMKDLPLSETEEMLWNYLEKINLYTPSNIVNGLGSWGFYTKNGERNWIAIWTGINDEWEKADKIYIVVMTAE
jgi:hypothetical protein